MQVATPKKGYKLVKTSFGKYEEIPEEWELTKFNEISKIKRGASPRPIADQKYFGNGRGWIRIRDVTKSQKYLENTEDYLSKIGESKSVPVNPNDLIMSIAASLAVPIILKMEACIHDGFIVFSNLSKSIDVEFLYFMLLQSRSKFLSQGQMGTQNNLNAELVGETIFPLPLLPEQKQIASILSNVDDTIQKTDQIIKQTQLFKKAMMQKLLTRGIGHTKFKKVKWYFGKEIEIPEEWELVKLDNICSMITDGAHNSPKSVKNGYYFASVENIKNSQIHVESCTKISKNDYDYLVKGNCQPKKDDVLFSKDGTVGVSFVFQQNTDLVLLSSIAIIRTKSSFDSFFCNYSLQSNFLKKHLYSFVGGTGLKRIILKDIKNYQFPLPPLPEQKQITFILSNIDTQIQKEKLHKSNLESLKKGMMQKLLTGQIRVKV